MDVVRDFLNPGWVSSAIGVVSLVIALVIYRASVVGARPVYQRRCLRLIGKDEQALPEDVEILFKGQVVDRLTKNHIVFWNSGKKLIQGSDIVAEDPLRCEFSDASRVLDARVVTSSRAANKFAVDFPSTSTNRINILFDYLDPGDGAVVEVLHTDSARYPEIRGTIKGVPKGCLDWGRIRSSASGTGLPSPFTRRRMIYIAGIIGLLSIFFGLLLPESGLQKLSESSGSHPPLRIVFVTVGVIYTGMPLLMLWLTRRRFPRALSTPALDE